jgi:hypothetical protein
MLSPIYRRSWIIIMLIGLSKFAIRFGLIPIAYGLLRLYFLSIRTRTDRKEELRAYLRQGGKLIAAIWHQRILIALDFARGFGDFTPSVMISQSRDGDMIADVYRRLNFRPVRGSSSRGGRRAMAEMVKDLAVNQTAVHVVDGPQGPRGVIKAGLISMAQLSGVPIIPISVTATRAWVLGSWDRFLIPKPFSTVHVYWDNPIRVPPDLDGDLFEAYRLKIERQMRESQESLDRSLGWRESLF